MFDYIKRLLLALFMMLLISLFIIGGRQTIINAEEIAGIEKLDWYCRQKGLFPMCSIRNGKHKGIDIAKESGHLSGSDDGVVTKSYY